MHLNNIDIFDIVFVAIMAYAGLSRGFLGSVLVIAGSFISLTFLRKFVEMLIHKFPEKLPKSYQNLLAFILLIIFGYIIGIVAHKIFSGNVRGGLLGVIDRLVGAALHAVGAAFLLWLAMPMALEVIPQSFAQQMHQSVLEDWTQKYMPDWLADLPQKVKTKVEQSHLGAQKAQLPPHAPVISPHDFTTSPAQKMAAQSVVKIISLEPKCKQEIAGTGFYFQPNYIMTNAHVIAGSDSISVRSSSSVSAAIPVYFNPNEDIAILYDADIAGIPLELAQDDSNISDPVVIGYPGGGKLTITHETFMGEENLMSSNIYGQAGITRKVMLMHGGIEHGNSGGPVVAPDGTVVGMVFGAENHDNKKVYSLAISELSNYIQRLYGQDPIDTGQCVLT